MIKVHNFHESLKVGDKGELIIMNFLEESPNVNAVIDVSGIPDYQEVDVDAIVKMKTGKEFSIEIKTDTYTSGNIYYETISAIETGSQGCFLKTEADYIFYYFLNMEVLYILEVDRYQQWFNEREEAFKNMGYQKQVKNSRWDGSHYTSIGYAYPVSVLEADNPVWMRKVYLN